MSDLFEFIICPKCKKPFDEDEGEGYIGDTIKCWKCKTIFTIEVVLKEQKNEKNKHKNIKE
jgi:phage FluMu protein Com